MVAQMFSYIYIACLANTQTKPVPIMHKEQLKINKISADPCGRAV